MNRENALVIDVREPKDYKAGHVAGALNWPLTKLDDFLAEIPKYSERPLLVMCKVGSSAGAAVKKLTARASDVSRISGGMMNGPPVTYRPKIIRSSHGGVTLYTTGICPYCHAAKRLFESKGEIQRSRVDRDLKSAEMMKRSNRRTVPQIWVGDTHVGGFDEPAPSTVRADSTHYSGSNNSG